MEAKESLRRTKPHSGYIRATVAVVLVTLILTSIGMFAPRTAEASTPQYKALYVIATADDKNISLQDYNNVKSLLEPYGFEVKLMDFAPVGTAWPHYDLRTELTNTEYDVLIYYGHGGLNCAFIMPSHPWDDGASKDTPQEYDQYINYFGYRNDFSDPYYTNYKGEQEPRFKLADKAIIVMAGACYTMGFDMGEQHSTDILPNNTVLERINEYSYTFLHPQTGIKQYVADFTAYPTLKKIVGSPNSPISSLVVPNDSNAQLLTGNHYYSNVDGLQGMTYRKNKYSGTTNNQVWGKPAWAGSPNLSLTDCLGGVPGDYNDDGDNTDPGEPGYDQSVWHSSPLPSVPVGYDNLSYFAEGYTGSGFQEYLTLGNPEDSAAEVQIVYLSKDGTWKERAVTVPARSRSTVDVNADVGPDKEVAARIASNRAIVAERPMYFAYNGTWAGGHDTPGATEPSTTWYFAEGYTGPGFDEYICVLNPQSVPANLTFYFQTQEAGEVIKDGLGVPAQSRATFRVNDLLGPDYQNSLKLSSDIPVVAERPMYFDYQGTGAWGWQGGHCVMGVNRIANEYYFAEGTTRDGFEEWLTLQNPNSDAIAVTATYQLGSGQGGPVTKEYSIPPGYRHTVFVPDDIAEGMDVSVKLSSQDLFLAERPMYFSYSYMDVSAQGGHCVIGSPQTAQEWFFAEGYTGDGFNQWLCIQNPSDESVSVGITYLTQEVGALAEITEEVPARSRRTFMVNDHGGQGYQLSTAVRVISGPSIVAERPMYFVYNGWGGGHDVVGHTP